MSIAQSVHQEQLEYYNNLGKTAEEWADINASGEQLNEKSNCKLTHKVFGWHPYWVNGSQGNYDWDLISDLSYFSYEVDANTGYPLTIHNFMNTAVVDDAQNNNTPVNLCVTLFSDHTTFFSSQQSMQNLIDSLIATVQARKVNGVNIDFEGIPSSQAPAFNTFMANLSDQMHAAIPGSQVSMALYAVDWNNVFDFNVLVGKVDLFIVMGYGYYYSGSNTAGPTDPLFHFGSSYNYTLSRTITYYLNQGTPKDQLLLGLPYYGYEWATNSSNLYANTTSSGNAITYSIAKYNTSGNFSNPQWEGESFTNFYSYTDGGSDNQFFVNSSYSMEKRLQLIRRRGLAGMGIWALGFDGTHSGYNDAIGKQLSDCYSFPCYDTIYDMGGPEKNYYDDEDYTYTLKAPTGTGIILTMNEFNVELDYDYLYIYDGVDTSANQVQGSPFTGQLSPFTITSSDRSLTLRFVSDGATVTPGFRGTYSCYPLPPSSIEENTAQYATFYPNPGQDQLNIRLNDNVQIQQIGIYNIAGKCIKKEKINQSGTSYSIETSDLKNGLYLIRVFDKNNSVLQTGKWIKAQ